MIAIIANGAPLATAQERLALAQCDVCICCDRLPPDGAPRLLQVVGDMDSCTEQLPSDLLTDLHEDQETNDLTKAMQWAARNTPNESLAFFCVTGKREDHTLANLALIYETGNHAHIYTPSGHFYLLPAGHHIVPATVGSSVSFLSFTPQRITARGVQWPVEDLLLTSLWRATLNRCTEDQLILTCEQPLYIYQPWSSYE